MAGGKIYSPGFDLVMVILILSEPMLYDFLTHDKFIRSIFQMQFYILIRHLRVYDKFVRDFPSVMIFYNMRYCMGFCLPMTAFWHFLKHVGIIIKWVAA